MFTLVCIIGEPSSIPQLPLIVTQRDDTPTTNQNDSNERQNVPEVSPLSRYQNQRQNDHYINPHHNNNQENGNQQGFNLNNQINASIQGDLHEHQPENAMGGYIKEVL